MSSLTIGPSPRWRYGWWLICTIAGSRNCNDSYTASFNLTIYNIGADANDTNGVTNNYQQTISMVSLDLVNEQPSKFAETAPTVTTKRRRFLDQSSTESSIVSSVSWTMNKPSCANLLFAATIYTAQHLISILWPYSKWSKVSPFPFHSFSRPVSGQNL